MRTDKNNASIYSQSQEIKEAIPMVIEAAKKDGYNIDKMTVAGGSAGHALAMIYAYRDGKDAPVPVVLTYGAVGPASLHVEDWGIFGLGYDSDESYIAASLLFSIMSSETITAEEIKDSSYLAKVKKISAVDLLVDNPVPTVVAYGKYDKIQPFAASKRLETVLKEHKVDYQYFELTHSGHGLQNDDVIYGKWMETVEKYLAKYMPIE